MRSLKLISRFYTGLFLANLLVTLSCIGLRIVFGDKVHLVLPILFWYKAIATVLIFYLGTYNKKNEFYYYQNLGVSRSKLIISTILFDIFLGIVLFTITF